MLFILVQIQAGPPRFALTGYAWRSHAKIMRSERVVRRSWSEAEEKTDWAGLAPNQNIENNPMQSSTTVPEGRRRNLTRQANHRHKSTIAP